MHGPGAWHVPRTLPSVAAVKLMPNATEQPRIPLSVISKTLIPWCWWLLHMQGLLWSNTFGNVGLRGDQEMSLPEDSLKFVIHHAYTLSPQEKVIAWTSPQFLIHGKNLSFGRLELQETYIGKWYREELNIIWRFSRTHVLHDGRWGKGIWGCCVITWMTSLAQHPNRHAALCRFYYMI